MFFQREVLTDGLIRNLMALNIGHHREVSAHQDMVLRPDYAGYLAAQQAGQLRIYTVRERSTYRLQGYAVYFVRLHPHFTLSLQAAQDVIYLDPSARQGWRGYQFIQWCDAQLQDEGVEIVYQHVTPARDFGALLERMGYEAVDLTYARRLDHGSGRTHHRRRVRGRQHGAHDQREQQRPSGQPTRGTATGHVADTAAAGAEGPATGGADGRRSDGAEHGSLPTTRGPGVKLRAGGDRSWEKRDVADGATRISLIYAARGLII